MHAQQPVPGYAATTPYTLATAIFLATIATPIRARLRRSVEDASGVLIGPSAANPVAMAPLLRSAAKAVTNTCPATSKPCAFGANTSEALDQGVALALVSVNVKWSTL